MLDVIGLWILGILFGGFGVVCSIGLMLDLFIDHIQFDEEYLLGFIFSCALIFFSYFAISNAIDNYHELKKEEYEKYHQVEQEIEKPLN